jgi:hypothetical protein
VRRRIALGVVAEDSQFNLHDRSSQYVRGFGWKRVMATGL